MRRRLIFTLACLFLSLGIAMAQTTLSGTVVSSEDGEPIIGATVTEKGTQNATVTDIDGNYSLHVSNRNATLVVSYIGYVSQEVKAGSNVNII